MRVCGATRALAVVVLAGMALAALGCGMARETLPARAAMEQLLLSTAADRSVRMLPVGIMMGQATFLDTSNLEGYDQKYLVQAVRRELLSSGAKLVDDVAEAEAIVEVASGALSIDKRSYIFGIPELPIPLPYVDGALKFPELPIFKIISLTGKSKVLATAREAKTGAQIAELPITYGQANTRYWWLLFTGPYEWTDLPKEVR